MMQNYRQLSALLVPIFRINLPFIPKVNFSAFRIFLANVRVRLKKKFPQVIRHPSCAITCGNLRLSNIV